MRRLDAPDALAASRTRVDDLRQEVATEDVDPEEMVRGQRRLRLPDELDEGLATE
jgi:hypothetical protein